MGDFAFKTFSIIIPENFGCKRNLVQSFLNNRLCWFGCILCSKYLESRFEQLVNTPNTAYMLNANVYEWMCVYSKIKSLDKSERVNKQARELQTKLMLLHKLNHLNSDEWFSQKCNLNLLLAHSNGRKEKNIELLLHFLCLLEFLSNHKERTREIKLSNECV